MQRGKKKRKKKIRFFEEFLRFLNETQLGLVADGEGPEGGKARAFEKPKNKMHFVK